MKRTFKHKTPDILRKKLNKKNVNLWKKENHLSVKACSCQFTM